MSKDFQDESLFRGISEFAAHGERYRYRDRGAGVWSRFEFDEDNLNGGCYIHTGLVSAPSDATPRQLDAAGETD